MSDPKGLIIRDGKLYETEQSFFEYVKDPQKRGEMNVDEYRLRLEVDAFWARVWKRIRTLWRK